MHALPVQFVKETFVIIVYVKILCLSILRFHSRRILRENGTCKIEHSEELPFLFLKFLGLLVSVSAVWLGPGSLKTELFSRFFGNSTMYCWIIFGNLCLECDTF